MALSVSLPLTFDVAPPSPKHSTSLLFSPLLSSSAPLVCAGAARAEQEGDTAGGQADVPVLLPAPRRPARDGRARDEGREPHPVRYITSRHVTLHVALYYTTLHYSTLHYIILSYDTLRYVALRCVALRYVALHYIT